MSQLIKDKCHFIGIGGIGMSGLARILLGRKVYVSGSDISKSYVTEGLERSGAKVFLGHSESNVTPDMTVIYSSDIKNDNPELAAARRLQCPLLHRSDLLLSLMSDYKTLAVAGTHGKTTTTSLLASLLIQAGMNPGYAVGGILPDQGTNAAHGEGDYFVAEADESDGTFLKYRPYGAIVTNIDNDHLDYYKNLSKLEESFAAFLGQVESPSHLFWCGDDPRLAALNPAGISYGFGSHCDLKVSNFRQKGWSIFFDIVWKEREFRDIELRLTGRHNALNGAAVFGLALALRIPEDTIRKAFSSFRGVLRRCEIKGEEKGVLIVDDYAHHPTEIRATLHAIRDAVRERRLIAVFQPHRYSRTRDCLGTYGRIFENADEVIVTDIFAAGEAPVPGVTSEIVYDEIRRGAHIPVRYLPRKALAEALGETLRPHDVVLGLGAGDITKLGSELLAYLKNHPPKKYRVGVVFGGKSVEHEISLLSAAHVIRSLRSEFYDVVHFGITKSGNWISGPDTLERLKQGESGAGAGGMIPPELMQELLQCDLFFPVLHGRFGEDGTIQGFFEILGKPYVGCDHCASAVCMDKALTKKLMLMNGVPTVPYVDFSIRDWKGNRESILRQIEMQLTYPLFVKPVHLGSTIGISKAKDPGDLEACIDKALTYDFHIVVENGLEMREIEFAVLGNGWVEAFPPGEITSQGAIYDYDSKYGPNAIKAIPRADLPEALVNEGRELALIAYKAAGCTGMARVDTFLDRQQRYWLNEINPIPGFTKTSLYPQMCEVNGMPAEALADRLVVLSLEKARCSNKEER